LSEYRQRGAGGECMRMRTIVIPDRALFP
jgi:hypothetical protein